jgi:hypothetical protein
MKNKTKIVNGRTINDWAVTALMRGINKSLDESKSPAEAAKSLRRGMRTAESWLDGTHPRLVD